jgi:glycosyltransferase involved in cell wall biosynthesis
VSRAFVARGAHAARSSISVVVNTHERPRALDAVLRALSEQSDAAFDVVVADDGSGPETREVVERWRRVFGTRLEHVWQPDEGFRLALARNRGALAARGRYLVFLDGDSVPRSRFVEAMRRSARRSWFVAGRRLELSPRLTERLLSANAPIHRRSLAAWLLSARDVSRLSTLTSRDRRVVGGRGVPEFEPHGRAYGFLLGVFRRDFERANGYDSRFVGWGEEDVDLATRLRRLGLRCGHAGPQATVLHLWHPPQDERERSNWALLLETTAADRIEAEHGLLELARTADASVA